MGEWYDHAACIGHDTDLFFPRDEEVAGACDAALIICASCPVISECSEKTLNEPAGIWGGRTSLERQEERNRRARVRRREKAAAR